MILNKNINGIKLLGVSGSILLIVYYTLFFIDYVDYLHPIIRYLIFYCGILSFYYSLYKFMIYNKFKLESKIILIWLIVQSLLMISDIINTYFLPVDLWYYILIAVSLLLMAMFGIKIWIIKRKNVIGLRLLKWFMILFFASLITIGLLLFISYHFHKFYNVNHIVSVLIIPYVFGFIFCVRYLPPSNLSNLREIIINRKQIEK